MAAERQPSLILLDLDMPGLDGYEVLRRLKDAKATRDVPVIILSGMQGAHDKVTAFDLGAVDYVTKPFGVHELLARVEALLRRTRTASAAAREDGEPAAPVFTLGQASIDRRKFTATVGDRSVALTARELKLAEVFAARAGEVLTRDALLNTVWGVDYFGTTRTLDQHVAQLRKKIEADSDAPSPIATVHGVGYRYDG